MDGYFKGLLTWLLGLLFRWQLEHPVVAAVCLLVVHEDVDVWQASQVAGYAEGLFTCDTGLLAMWQDEQPELTG